MWWILRNLQRQRQPQMTQGPQPEIMTSKIGERAPVGNLRSVNTSLVGLGSLQNQSWNRKLKRSWRRQEIKPTLQEKSCWLTFHPMKKKIKNRSRLPPRDLQLHHWHRKQHQRLHPTVLKPAQFVATSSSSPSDSSGT